MSKPRYKVTAIVSTYNAERFIGPCIEDLENQTIADRTEIIVIDSASPQNEEVIVRSYQQKYNNIRYIRTAERETLYRAWNRGIAIAQGRYITNANTDDRHRRDAFEKMTAVLDASPNVALVYADVHKTDLENQVFGQCAPTGRFEWYDWNRSLLLQKGCFMGPQPMWRREVHDVFGDFNDNLISSGDYEFWLRISQLYEFRRLQIPLGLYLERDTSVEHVNSNRKAKEDLAVQAQYLQAAVQRRLINCRLLERLRRLLTDTRRSPSAALIACLTELERFICPDQIGRSLSVRHETDSFLKLKYRITSGMVSHAQIDRTIDQLARLILVSTRWFPSFWEKALLREKSDRTARVNSDGAAPSSASGAGRRCGTSVCQKGKGLPAV